MVVFFFLLTLIPVIQMIMMITLKVFLLTKILVIPIIPMITLKVFFADFDPGDPDDPEDHFKSFFSLVPVILITLKLPVVIFSTIIQPCSQLLLQ